MSLTTGQRSRSVDPRPAGMLARHDGQVASCSAIPRRVRASIERGEKRLAFAPRSRSTRLGSARGGGRSALRRLRVCAHRVSAPAVAEVRGHRRRVRADRTAAARDAGGRPGVAGERLPPARPPARPRRTARLLPRRVASALRRARDGAVDPGGDGRDRDGARHAHEHRTRGAVDRDEREPGRRRPRAARRGVTHTGRRRGCARTGGRVRAPGGLYREHAGRPALPGRRSGRRRSAQRADGRSRTGRCAPARPGIVLSEQPDVLPALALPFSIRAGGPGAQSTPASASSRSLAGIGRRI